MSAKADGFASDLLNLIFRNADLAQLGDAAGLQGSTAAGTLSIALHTADPTSAGTQLSNEAAYTGYARVTVNRDTGGWSDASAGTPKQTDNVAAITFAESSSGPESITHVSIGNGVSDEIIYSGALDATLVVNSGVVPEFGISALKVAEA